MAVFTNMMNKMKTNKKACCVLCFVLFILFFVTMDTNVYEGLDNGNSAVEANRAALVSARDKLKNDISNEINLLGSGLILGSSLLNDLQMDTTNYQNAKNNLENSIAAKKNK
jgi:hypothetical protein